MKWRFEFEELYIANSDAPGFIVRDMLVTGAEGQYWHAQTKMAYLWFCRGMEHEKA